MDPVSICVYSSYFIQKQNRFVIKANMLAYLMGMNDGINISRFYIL